MYGDGTKSEHPAPMISFLNHVEAISDLLKDKLLEKDSNAQNWMSPLKIQDGSLIDINVKVTSDNVKNAFIACPYKIRCVVKINCVNVNANRSGASFVLIKAFPEL